MSDPFDILKRRMMAMPPASPPKQLPFLQAPSKSELIVSGSDGTILPPVDPPAIRRSALGDRILLGHSVYRQGGGYVVGDSNDVMTALPLSHLLTIASSGSGKSAALAMPNLLNYSGSAFVIDPKGELAWATAWYRKHHLGHDVSILDPYGVVEGIWQQAEARWPGRYDRDETVISTACNPLANLDVDDILFDRVARDLAAGIAPREPGDNRFFSKTSQALVYRAIRAVCGGYAGVTINDRFVPMPKSLVSVRRLIEQGKSGIRQVMERCESRDPRFAAQLQTYLGNSDSVEDTIRTAEAESDFLTDRALELFLEPELQQRQFDLASLGDRNRNQSVYLVVPTDMFSTLGGWLRLMLQRALRESMRRPKEEKTIYIIDEAGSLGRIDNLLEAYSLGRSAGICCWSFFQNIGQVKEQYGTAYSTMEASSEVTSFHKLGDYDSAHFMAEKIGRHDRLRRTHSTSYSSSPNGGSSSSSSSSAWQSEPAFDAAMIEQISQGLIGNFMKQRHGGLYWSAPMDYWATPHFNGLHRPNPDKPFLGDAPFRGPMTVGEFTAWRKGHVK